MAGTESLIFFKENSPHWTLEPLYLRKCIVVPFPILLEVSYRVVILHFVTTLYSFLLRTIDGVELLGVSVWVHCCPFLCGGIVLWGANRFWFLVAMNTILPKWSLFTYPREMTVHYTRWVSLCLVLSAMLNSNLTFFFRSVSSGWNCILSLSIWSVLFCAQDIWIGSRSESANSKQCVFRHSNQSLGAWSHSNICVDSLRSVSVLLLWLPLGLQVIVELWLQFFCGRIDGDEQQQCWITLSLFYLIFFRGVALCLLNYHICALIKRHSTTWRNGYLCPPQKL